MGQGSGVRATVCQGGGRFEVERLGFGVSGSGFRLEGIDPHQVAPIVHLVRVNDYRKAVEAQQI